MKTCIQKFQSALGDSERQVLQQCLQHALQPLPEDAMPWYLLDAHTPAGYLTPAHAEVLRSIRKDWKTLPHGLLWDAPDSSHAARSAALAQLAAELRDLGHITGWRTEKVSYWTDAVIRSEGQAENQLSIWRLHLKWSAQLIDFLACEAMRCTSMALPKMGSCGAVAVHKVNPPIQACWTTLQLVDCPQENLCTPVVCARWQKRQESLKPWH
jgi:hypothetical protein